MLPSYCYIDNSKIINIIKKDNTLNETSLNKIKTKLSFLKYSFKNNNLSVSKNKSKIINLFKRRTFIYFKQIEKLLNNNTKPKYLKKELQNILVKRLNYKFFFFNNYLKIYLKKKILFKIINFIIKTNHFNLNYYFNNNNNKIKLVFKNINLPNISSFFIKSISNIFGLNFFLVYYYKLFSLLSVYITKYYGKTKNINLFNIFKSQVYKNIIFNLLINKKKSYIILEQKEFIKKIFLKNQLNNSKKNKNYKVENGLINYENITQHQIDAQLLKKNKTFNYCKNYELILITLLNIISEVKTCFYKNPIHNYKLLNKIIKLVKKKKLISIYFNNYYISNLIKNYGNIPYSILLLYINIYLRFFKKKGVFLYLYYFKKLLFFFNNILKTLYPNFSSFFKFNKKILYKSINLFNKINLNNLLWHFNKKNHNQKSLNWIFKKYWFNLIVYKKEFDCIKKIDAQLLKKFKYYTSFNNKLSINFYYNKKYYNFIKERNLFKLTNKTNILFNKNFNKKNKLEQNIISKNRLLLISYFLF